MYQVVFLLCFCISSAFCAAQNDEVKLLIDETIGRMKNNAINAGKVNWAEIEKRAADMAQGLDDPYKLGPVMRYLFESIDDFHGTFFYMDSAFNWKKKRPDVSDSIMNEWKKGASIRTSVLEKNIGYLRIPSILVGSEQEFHTKAQRLNDSLCHLLSTKLKGVIIDLRLNGGGAMHPMILGVQNLLAPGKVGTFHSKRNEDWILRDNSFLVDSVHIARIIPKCTTKAEQLPVVILTSSETGSSGEFLIMAFKGRPNTILLGDTTAGYITSNNGFQIGNRGFLNLAVGYGADRNGKVYTEAITPDIVIESVDSFNNIVDDIKVNAAIKWIKKH